MAHDKRTDHNEDMQEATGPLRTSVGSREQRHPQDMVRFVLTPERAADLCLPGTGTPAEGESTLMLDWSGRAPGRSAWLTPDPDCITRALHKGGFHKAMRTRLRLPSEADLTKTLLEGLQHRFVQRLTLARRAGALVAGENQVSTVLKQGRGSLLILARDLSPGGQKKQGINAQRKGIAVTKSAFYGAQLGKCIGREYAGVILVCKKPFSADLQRLSFQIQQLQPVQPEAEAEGSQA